jgi:hypothetical protein
MSLEVTCGAFQKVVVTQLISATAVNGTRQMAVAAIFLKVVNIYLSFLISSIYL